MTSLEYDILICPPADHKLWTQWRSLVESERWIADDHSVTHLTPGFESTRCVAAVTKDGGDFMGSVVWNEYGDLAWIGFYLLSPEHRGKGLGSVIWERAIEMIPKTSFIGLRAVSAMAPRYQSKNTPIVRDDAGSYYGNISQYKEMINTYGKSIYPSGSFKRVKDLTQEEYLQFLAFDKMVTGRDREKFLRKQYALSFVEGACLFADNKLVAFASVVRSGPRDEFIYKIAPIYASTVEQAFTVISPLVEHVAAIHPEAILHCHLVKCIGAKLLASIFERHNLTYHEVGKTLFSAEMPEKYNHDMIFVPNNHSCHYDA